LTGERARPAPRRLGGRAQQGAGGGRRAEAEYDLGVLMREDPVELLHGDPHRRERWLAARCGLDATAIWQWGVVERVSTGLLCTKIELQPVGREMLATADHVAG
jgi:streptomycin 6-kinase